MKIIILAMALMALPAICVGQQQEVSLDAGVAAHAGIDDIYKKFSSAYRTLDHDLVAGLYTENALYLTPQSGIDRGRDLINKNFKAFFDNVRRGGGKLNISFRILERQVSGPLAYDVGIYTLTNTTPERTNTSKGKFVIIALKQPSGEWKFQLDSFSPMPLEKK